MARVILLAVDDRVLYTTPFVQDTNLAPSSRLPSSRSILTISSSDGTPADLIIPLIMLVVVVVVVVEVAVVVVVVLVVVVVAVVVVVVVV